MPRDMQRHALRQVSSSGGSGPNYNPTRRNFPDLVNRRAGAFDAVPTSWDKAKENVLAKCRSKSEQTMNLAVAKSLYYFCVDNKIEAREVDGFPISFSVGPKLMCWSPALFLYRDRATVPFIDLRRAYNLQREAQRFIFSAQNEALRVQNPDYKQVGLEILRFADDERRTISVVSEAGYRLFSYDELESMISYTQRLWIDVCLEKTAKRRASGRKGPDDLL